MEVVGTDVLAQQEAYNLAGCMSGLRQGSWAALCPCCPKLPQTATPPASPALEHNFLLPAARSILDLQIALQPNDVFQPAKKMLAKVPRPAGAVDVEVWGVVAAEAEARRAADAAVRQAAAMVTIMEDVAQLKEMLG